MNKEIPIFFSCDDNYIPYLGVAIRSLADNASNENEYIIHILNQGIKENYKKSILSLKKENIKIKFVDVAKKISPLFEYLNLRDYYTISIYFRIFIPAMFHEYKKAIYLDSDIVVLDDIAKLYNTDLKENIVGAVSDDIIASKQVFIDYAEKACGIPYREYFNSGVMLMDLEKMRDMNLEVIFSDLLQKYRFPTICPDQDYLNVICKGKVLYLGKGWDKMSIDDNYDGKPHIVHYNMFNKPWQYKDVCYGEYFWEYAEKTPFYDEIKSTLDNFSKEDAEMQIIGCENLEKSAHLIAKDKNNFANVLFKERANV